MGQGPVLTLAGFALGLVGAAALARVLTGLPFGVGPTDPVALAAASGFPTVAALPAGCLPARRAAGVDPNIVPRNE